MDFKEWEIFKDTAKRNNCNEYEDRQFNQYYDYYFKGLNSHIALHHLMDSHASNCINDAKHIWSTGKHYGLNDMAEYLKNHIDDQDAITGQFLHNLIKKYLKVLNNG